ncbi:MAG: bifunctional phosphopantothenoylcysteine decarboxylase/phosphopantothenate--cysteine ligase CoaBC [Mariprofundales bacterium]|nr:bifunctional phosphopantothenoylcysteine decarboxylase/phosphopantothenate--cysteine ligase CoaBC [Mariprofundales bacterium]
MQLAGRHLLLGLGGGIACYRTAELVRLLRQQGAVVRCVMTASAERFVTPLLLESLSGERVYNQLFALTDSHTMGHISLARWAELLLIAPATANLIAKLTHGIADDLLTTLAQVCEAPLMVAPAMNRSMWHADSCRRNVAQLQAAGAVVVGPEKGMLACGEDGVGRMRTPEQLLDDIVHLFTPSTLRGERWVITTGPTWEAWDSVRILTNRASGRLGAKMAHLAALHDATVTLIAGPGTPEVAGVLTIAVESAEEMLAAALQHAAGADLFLSAAAVSDYRVAQPARYKLKRADGVVTHVELVESEDIVASVAAMEQRPARVVAFAAEELSVDRDAALAEGWRKLSAKGVDGVVVNDVATMSGDGSCGGYWLTHSAAPQLLNGDNKDRFAADILQAIGEWGGYGESYSRDNAA